MSGQIQDQWIFYKICLDSRFSSIYFFHNDFIFNFVNNVFFENIHKLEFIKTNFGELSSFPLSNYVYERIF